MCFCWMRCSISPIVKYKMNRTKGFTLLEAIVALTIFSTSSMALYSWYSTSMYGLMRASERLQTVEFMRNVESELRRLNLTEASKGEVTGKDFVARWEATLVEKKKDGKNAGGQMGYYRLGLYEVSIELYRVDDDQLIDEYSTRLVGYEGVRIPRLDLGLSDVD